jgi:hypothetical protein
MTTAASTQKSKVLTDAVLEKAASARQQTEKKQEVAKVDISANTFAKIIFNEALNPEQKRAAVTEALVFTGTKEENRTRIREFEDLKEYLQGVRSKLSEKIISMTDTETFSELKLIYDQINGSLVDFDNKMAPLTDIIDAVYTLRTNGETLNTFREILADREREKEVQEKRAGFEADINGVNAEISRLNNEMRAEGEKKTFLFRKVKPEALARIEDIKAEIARKNVKLGQIRNDIVELNRENEEVAGRVGKYDQEKAKLRELLDISTDQHRARQEALVGAALNFVQVSKDRLGAVRTSLGRMNTQVENLADTNSDMTQIYAILNEGVKSAEKDNQSLRDTLSAPEGDESLIAKNIREGKLDNINDGIKMLDASAADTMLSYGDLTTQTIRIKVMKDSNDEQITRARTLHAQGVAGVADRLSVVLQAVSSAAINESSSMAQNTLEAMSDNTNRIAQKEVIRVATGTGEISQQVDKAMADLAAYGEVSRAATDLTRAGVREMREKLEQMQKVAEDVQADIKESLSVHADVNRESNPGTGAAKTGTTGGVKLPFGDL